LTSRTAAPLALALSVVKGLIGLHDGEVSAHSAGLGKGTELVVRLPIVYPVSLRAPVSPTAPRRRRRILDIEDNMDAATSLCEVLEIDNHEAAVACDGK
jgi:hypothetical protein